MHYYSDEDAATACLYGSKESLTMTQEEVITALNTFRSGPPALMHAYIEGLLLGFLSREGYEEIAEAYHAALHRLHIYPEADETP